MVFREQLAKIYHDNPHKTIRNILIPLISGFLDWLLVGVTGGAWDKLVPKGLDYPCGNRDRFYVCSPIDTAIVTLPLATVSFLLHLAIVYGMVLDLPRKRILRGPLKLVGYNLICVSLAIYGYYYNESKCSKIATLFLVAFENAIAFISLRICLYALYRIGRGLFWCCEKCNHWEERKNTDLELPTMTPIASTKTEERHYIKFGPSTEEIEQRFDEFLTMLKEHRNSINPSGYVPVPLD
ncbi:hypothetical protein L596_009779 [Steinernema carpocapsae]|uniref:Uncharacterized protein n=1 Tax=Steinernema carpocapsae TaxID=34508 RepID=A0A4U5PGB6_STECR|nr:hypothetical protein L596_009779 [Steinernema carpocapsae]